MRVQRRFSKLLDEMKEVPEPEERESAEDFVRLLTKNERRIRAFIYGLVPNPESVDEIMQEVSVVLWKKFDQYEKGTEFLRWAYVVARYEVLMFRRKKARDRHVFDENLLELLAEEYVEVEEELSRERRALDKCMAELGELERKLLLTAYAQGQKINQLAEERGTTPMSLYKKLNRLRKKLLICIEKNVKTAAA